MEGTVGRMQIARGASHIGSLPVHRRCSGCEHAVASWVLSSPSGMGGGAGGGGHGTKSDSLSSDEWIELKIHAAQNINHDERQG